MTDTLLPQAVYASSQIRALEAHAREVLQLPAGELMARAASALWRQLRRRWPQARSLLVCAGPGDNGGDGWLLAALASRDGCRVSVLSLAADSRYPAAQAAVLAAGGEIAVYRAGMSLPAADVYVDALFGMGLNRAPEGAAAALIEALNQSGRPRLAVDVPSGLDADTGVCHGSPVRAELTVSLLAGKSGLVTAQARDWVGQLVIEPLGLSAAVADLAPRATALSRPRLAPRSRVAHKGHHGHLLIVGGDHGTGGAVHMAAQAALRCGAGLVSVASRGEQVLALQLASPEVMAAEVNGPPALEALLQRATALAVGPGLGQGAWGHALWLTALDSGKPLVLDADGLNMLASESHPLPSALVLTPHPAEAARLLQTDTAAIEADRYAAARALATRYQAVVVLKGAGSLVADPTGRMAYCPWGNPGMATGGMGDTLTGIIGALLVQGHAPWEAACDGVALHALAGDRAAADGERGLLPRDLLPWLRALVNEVDHG